MHFQITSDHVAKYGWVPFADLRQRSLAIKWNVEFTDGGKNYDPVWSRLWNKVHAVSRRCSRPLVVCNILVTYAYRISFRRYRPLKFLLSCEIAKKGGFGPPICRWKGYPRFRTCIFKLLPTMWLWFVVLVPSASSEIRGRKKKGEESLVKYRVGQKTGLFC